MKDMEEKYKNLQNKIKQNEQRPVVFVNACTHGQEQVGISVIEELERKDIKQGMLVTNIANERAQGLNVPFIETDLNRVFPGKKDGVYEEQLAYNMHPLIKSVDVVVDIHSTQTTSVGENSAIIVTKHDAQTKKIVDFLAPPKAIIMRCTKDNALISDARVGIGIEYGKDKEVETKEHVVNSIIKLLEFFGMTDEQTENTWSKKTEWYEATATLPKEEGDVLSEEVKNFKLCKKGTLLATGSERDVYAPYDFYPILFGNNRYTNIFGFMGRKVEN